MIVLLVGLIFAIVCVHSVYSFHSMLPVKSTLHFSNRHLEMKSDKEGNEEDGKSKLTFGGVIQLITMVGYYMFILYFDKINHKFYRIMQGAGAPSLGEYERTDETGKMFFRLEANNFVDAGS